MDGIVGVIHDFHDKTFKSIPGNKIGVDSYFISFLF